MTWTENEFSTYIKRTRGSLSEINDYEKKSSLREDTSTQFNASLEPKNYIHHIISRNNESKLKPFGDPMKMQKSNGTRPGKNFLKRSQSTNAGSCVVPDFRPTCLKSKNLDMIISHCDLLRKFRDLEHQRINLESVSRDSYQDDALSTNSDSTPLLPLHVPSCHEAHENEIFLSTSSSTSSFISNTNNTKVVTNLDSLSICDEDDVLPRISKMNEKKKAKPNIKSLYNIKTCSESDNKELNAAIQIAQSASSCFGSNKKSDLSRINSTKRSRWKVSYHKEDRKTFSGDTRLQEGYRSTQNEQLTYNELISKPNPLFNNDSPEDIQRQRLHSFGHSRNRHHSSLSDSENLPIMTGNECLTTSRSDGTEVHHFDNKLKLFINNCPSNIPSCHHKSYPSDMSPFPASKQYAISRSVTTSSRSLPSSLESNSRSFLLERQISTPLPNTSIVLLSELDETDYGPPLPSKGGSRSILSISDLENESTDLHSHTLLLKESVSTNMNQLMQDKLIQSTFSHEKTANYLGAIESKCTRCANNATSSLPPPLPSRTFHHNNINPFKGPPLPPKGLSHHKQTLFSHRPSSEESDNVEEISSSSESSNFTSSIDSEGLEHYSETCICRQLVDVDISKNSPAPRLCLANSDHYALRSISDGDTLEKAHAPMPGRYETSDSLVYDYIENPSLNFHSQECQHITGKVNVLRKRFPGISTNDLECALIESNYSVEEAIKHMNLKFNLTSSRYNNNDVTSCMIAPHRHHFVPDPMEV